MKSLLVILALGAAAPAQVHIVSAMPEPALATMRSYLKMRDPELAMVVEHRSTADLMAEAVASQPIGADILVGVDAQVLELFAADGALQQLAVPSPSGFAPFYVDPVGLYVVPWADAFVLAYELGRASVDDAPRTLAAMIDPRHADALVLPAPEAAPSVFVELIRGRLREGESTDEVFGMLVGIDARVSGWCSPAERALDRLVEMPRGGFAVAPLSAVKAAGANYGYQTLLPFTPLQGLGVAIGSRAEDTTRARSIVATLLEPEFAIRLAREHSLIPGIAATSGDLTLSGLADLVAVSAPIEPDRRFVRGWLVRFDADVRDQGRYSEVLGLWLDVIFLLLFLGAMVWIYRRSQVVDG